MAREEVIERSERVGHGRSREPLRIIGLSREEALTIVCYLTGSLAGKHIPGLTQGNGVTVSDRGTVMYRLILDLEDNLWAPDS